MDPAATGPPSLAVYGAGRTGLAVARLARERGVPLAGVWSRSPLDAGRRRLASELPVVVAEEPPHLIAKAWLLAVADDAIELVARRLAAVAAGAEELPGVAAHCAGALPVAAIEPLAELDIPIGSWHPVMTFGGGPGDAAALAGAWVALEGEPKAVGVLRDLTARLGPRSVTLTGEDRACYHAALVLASNGRVALSAAAERLLADAGIEPDDTRALLAPLVARTEENLATRAPTGALTGPVARGDARTVRLQLEALADRPELVALYRALAAIALGLVPQERREDGHRAVAELVGETRRHEEIRC